MDDRRRTLAAVAIIIGVVAVVAIALGAIVSGGRIISPVPQDPAIKIIFISPTHAAAPGNQITATPTP